MRSLVCPAPGGFGRRSRSRRRLRAGMSRRLDQGGVAGASASLTRPGPHDVRLVLEHGRPALIPVGLEPGLVGRRDRDDPTVVGRRQAEQVAEPPLCVITSEVRVTRSSRSRSSRAGPRHPSLPRARPCRPAPAEASSARLTALLRRPELDMGHGEVPVLLLDRADLGDGFALSRGIDVGVERGDDDRLAARLAAAPDVAAEPGRSGPDGRSPGRIRGCPARSGRRLGATSARIPRPSSRDFASAGGGDRRWAERCGRGCPTRPLAIIAGTRTTATSRPEKVRAQKAATAIRSLLMNMELITPLTSTDTVAGTVPAVIPSDRIAPDRLLGHRTRDGRLGDVRGHHGPGRDRRHQTGSDQAVS